MKIFKVAILLVAVIAVGCLAIPIFGSNTADVNLTVTLGSGPPVVQTVSIVPGETSFTANGYISSIGGASVYERGFCYIHGESGDPTITDNLLYESGNFTVGAYSNSAKGLPLNTPYRVRAYAINSQGTAYGVTLQTRTSIPGNMVLIRGVGTIKITGPSPFTTNISSIDISANTSLDGINIEVGK
jgi:hypothetical protein